MAKEDWDDVALTWRDLSSPLRGIFRLCILLALLVAGFGAYMDFAGHTWWAQKPFLINLVSSLAVALIGVPLGLVLLKTLTVRQEEWVEKLRAFRLARASAKELSEFAKDLTVGTHSTEDLLTLLENTHRYVYWCSDQLRRTNVSKSNDFQEQLNRLADPVSQADRAYKQFANEPGGRAVSCLEDTWRYWDTYVRPRLLSADLAWVTNGVDSQGRALEWRDLFANVEFTNGDIRHDIQLFRNGGPAEAMQTRLSALEASLIDRKNSVRDIALVVDFADRLRGEIGKVEESDVTSGTRKPGLFARMRA